VSEPEPSDESLIGAVARGDVGAFEQLYRRHAPRLHPWVVRALGSGADDALQEIFLALWRHADQFDPLRARFSTWLGAIARHHLGRELARLGRRRQTTAVDAIEAALAERTSPDPGVEDQVWERERDRAILAGLRALPPEQRRVIVLAFFVGLSQSAIAAQLELPLGTVKKRIRLGMQKLRAAVAEADERPSGAARRLRVVAEE
jgi:RNA polymerase sigma-70 factor (ECF subfamily)